MGLYTESAKLYNALKNNPCRNLWEFDACYRLYTSTTKNKSFYVVKGSDNLVLRWNGLYKGMHISLLQDYFTFSSWNKSAEKWNDDYRVEYGAVPEFLIQLEFLTPIHTLQHKNFKIFEGIKDIYFKSINGGIP